jgi:outer membrane receptor protein involved in Fe transport
MVSGFINYQSAYTDNRQTPEVPVASWTTVDFTVGYSVPSTIPVVKGTKLTFGILNAFNRNPPFLNNFIWPINYDGANANPLGRYISLELTKPW